MYDVLPYGYQMLAVRECGRPKRRQLDIERVLRLWDGGFWTQESIASVCKCHTATVRRILREQGRRTDRRWL